MTDVPANTIVLAYDVGPEAGLGHRRRMEVLASALEDLGGHPRLTAVDDLGPETSGGTPPVPPACVVVDSYRVRADDHDRFRARHVVAVDDLERDLRVDLLVDPNPGCDPATHASAREVLHGPRFALVAPTPRVTPAREPPSCVLVTTGAADMAGIGPSTAAALAGLLPEARVRVVVGPWGQEPSGAVEVVRTTDGLADALADADLVVCAGGVTLLEALLARRPVVALATADNQRRALTGAAAAGAIRWVDPPDPGWLGEAVLELWGDATARAALVAAGAAYLDGRGAARVARAVMALA
ncbi:MAG: hypothetical protein MUF83_08600 [Acidimicrobiales bacterium]|nr:hypothetical protein [Acidimicrobiales bacterium]